MIEATEIQEVKLITPRVFGDHRGFFLETYRHSVYSEAGIDLPFLQDNWSRSRRGVLRGLHYQLRHPQGKLVQVVRGAVFDVAVDIRRGSPTFGKWVGFELTETNHRQAYIPPDFAHGFVVLSEQVDFLYKCTDYYVGDDQMGIRWNDPDIGVQWGFDGDPVVSEKDQHLPFLSELPASDLPEYSA